jgi:hypothetical protein
MTALKALKAAHAAGVNLKTDGGFLVLKAATRPSATVVDLLWRHKQEVLALLAAREYESNEINLVRRPPWPPSDRQAPEGEPELEQTCSARRGRVEETGGVLLHFCIECGRFGPYGYGVRLRAGQLGRWYCHEHRPQETDEAKT